jgi:hypothetical protein
MQLLLAIVITVVVNGFLLWIAIMIADKGNQKNKFHVAVGWSIVILGAFFWPFFGLILGMVILMLILMNYYVVGFLRSILVIIVLFFLHIGLGVLLEALGLAAQQTA